MKMLWIVLLAYTLVSYQANVFASAPTAHKAITKDDSDTLLYSANKKDKKNQTDSVNVYDQIKISQDVIDLAKSNIDAANQIISWSGFILSGLGILLIVAGIIGLNEFSRIRKTEQSMRLALQEIQAELNRIQAFRSEIVRDTKQFIEQTYFFNAGVQAYNSGEYARARDLFGRILKVQKDIEAKFFIGKCYIYEEKLDDAEMVFREMLSENSNDGKAHYGLAMTWVEKDIQRAVEYCEKACELDPKNYAVSQYLAILFASQNRLPEALRVCYRSYSLNPGATNSFLLGCFYYVSGNIEKSEEFFDRSKFYILDQIDHASYVHWAYFQRGVIEGLHGNLGSSKKFIKMALLHNNTPRIRRGMKRQIACLTSISDKDKNVRSIFSYLEE